MEWRSPITSLLFQGGTPPNHDEWFDVVVNLESGLCVYADRVSEYLHLPCDDCPTIPANVERASDYVKAALLNGKKTLVHCSAGLNRSGIVVARTLVKLGYAPDEAIVAMRLARDPNVLCNRQFESYVLDGACCPPSFGIVRGG